MVLAVDQYCVVLSQFKTLHDRHKLSCVWWAEWNHNLQQDWGDPPILVLPMPISCYYHGHGIIYFNVLILWFLVIFCELWSSKKESKLVVDLPIAWCLECGKSRWLLLSPINHSQFLDKMPIFFLTNGQNAYWKLWPGRLNKWRGQLSNPQKILSSLANECKREFGCPILSRMLAYFSPNKFFLNALDIYSLRSQI